jgi:hypothetical protein
LIFACITIRVAAKFVKYQWNRITGTQSADVWSVQTDWPALATWLFALFLGIGLTFRIPAVRAVFDPWVGVPNLGWLLGFAFECTALYLEACGRLAVRRLSVPRYLHLYMILTLLVFGVIFTTSLANGPERLEYPSAETLSELVFMNAKYIFVFVMALVIGISYLSLYREEQGSKQKLLVRWRLLGLAITALGVVAYSALRAAFVSLSYVCPACRGLGVLRVLEQTSLRVVCLAWPAALLVSNRIVYSLISKPVEFLRRPAMRNYLQVVYEEISRPIELVQKPVPQGQSIPLKQSTIVLHRGSPGLQIYQILIGILDAKRQLLRFLEVEQDKSTTLYRQVKSLLEKLEVDNDLDYYELVEAYSNIGRMILREKKQRSERKDPSLKKISGRARRSQPAQSRRHVA